MISLLVQQPMPDDDETHSAFILSNIDGDKNKLKVITLWLDDLRNNTMVTVLIQWFEAYNGNP
ncbi:hypothetical protein [Photorhabdus bodei]|uniref:Uncharacterized protein n=1 Tax=Photorhabdus bodei TaxID=2029681 RepID=A0AAW6BQ86_9GAMM|nr:hypothetical protein [Photorhabdus bodei]MDB6373854.1 hypothetical protein [Photorhabdus bodei]